MHAIRGHRSRPSRLLRALGRAIALAAALTLAVLLGLAQPGNHRTAHAFTCDDRCSSQLGFGTDPLTTHFGFDAPGLSIPVTASAGSVVNLSLTVNNFGGFLSAAATDYGYFPDVIEIDMPGDVIPHNITYDDPTTVSAAIFNTCELDPWNPLCKGIPTNSGPGGPTPQCNYHGSSFGSQQGWTCSVMELHHGDFEGFKTVIQMPKDTNGITVTVKIDPNHVLPGNHANPDTATAQTTIHYPDLIGAFNDASNPPATVRSGAGFTYAVTMDNIGTGSTGLDLPVLRLEVDPAVHFTSFSIPGSDPGGYLCTERHPTVVSNRRWIDCKVQPMEAGHNIVLVANATAPDTAGSYTAIATADPDNQITEVYKFNNSQTIVTHVINDTTAPTVTPWPDRAPDAGGWYNHSLSVGWVGADPDDAPLSLNCDHATTYAGPDSGSVVLTGRCQDPVGNTGVGTFSLKYDSTPPAIVCGSADPYWHIANVTITCTASDPMSGLANASDATFTLSTSVAAGSESSNASTDTHQVCDLAGNCATAGPISGFMVDRQPPAITCASADGQWHATDVAIACTVTDMFFAGDGKFTLSTSVPAGTESANASTGTREWCDPVGLCSTAGPISGNMIDKAAPTLACIQPDSQWHATDVAVACTASDAGAGLGNASDAAFSLTTSVAAGTETANASTNSHQVCDAVGNCATAGPYSGIKVDKLAPALSCGSADGLWHQNDVTIGCSATDGGSGLASAADASFGLSTNVAAGTETANALTSAHQVCDAVGNCATAGPIAGNRIDKAPPSIACGAADGIWHATDVSIGCTTADGGSGLASAADANFSLSTAVAPGTETANASTGSRNVCDAVGNCATAGPIAGNKIDKKAPVTTAAPARLPALPGMPTVQVDITKVTVTPGGSLGPITCWSTQGVVVNLAAADGGSGVASITYSISGAQATAPTTVSGSQTAITLSKLGASTITYFATDKVGNVEPARKLLVLNGGLLSCVTVPQTAITLPISGTANIVGTLTITYGPTTSVKPFNVTFPFNLTRD